MKTPSMETLSFAGVGVAALALIAIGAPTDRTPPAPTAAVAPSPPGVSAGGFTLTSARIDLPIDDARYPDGPHADVVNANCTACHSASMALTQPSLTAEQWTATVVKMRDVYKAPVPDAAIPDIVAYLTAMSAGRRGDAAGASAAPGKAAPPGG